MTYIMHMTNAACIICHPQPDSWAICSSCNRKADRTISAACAPKRARTTRTADQVLARKVRPLSVTK